MVDRVTVPPELEAWQPGEWLWDDERREWRNGFAHAWETELGGFAVGFAEFGPIFSTTCAEASANLRAAALAAAGVRPRVTYRIEQRDRDGKTVHVAILSGGLARLEIVCDDAEAAEPALKTSEAWVFCTALGFTPEREQ